MTEGTKSAAATAAGRDLRAMVRAPWHLLRTGGRRPAPRSPATNTRDADRRVVMRRLSAGTAVRKGVGRGMFVPGLGYGRRPHRCLQSGKESFPGGRKL
jgi:hypothetical protein